MRIVLACLLLCAALGSAHAEQRAPQPLPRFELGVSFMGFGAGTGASSIGGMGLNFEMGVSRGRWQMFGEAAQLWGFHEKRDGMGGRFGAGVRYLARSVEVDSSAAIELFGEASLGLEAFAWRQGGQLVQPDLSLGGGVQVRLLQEHRVLIHFGGRLLLVPSQTEPIGAACRGMCSGSSSSVAQGFMALMGAQW